MEGDKMAATFIAGVLLALLTLSLKTGIILGTSWLGKRQVVIVSATFGTLLFLLAVILMPFTMQVVRLTEKYTFPASLIMAGLFIYLGLNEGDYCCDGKKQAKKSDVVYIAVFLPCPFCLIAMALSIIFFKQQTGLDRLVVDLSISLVFALVLVLVAFGTRWLIGRKGINPSRALNALLLFVGLAIATLSLFIPNFVSAAQMDFSPICIDSWQVMLFALLLISFLATTGYMVSLKKGNL
jgi:predicted transporter